MYFTLVKYGREVSITKLRCACLTETKWPLFCFSFVYLVLRGDRADLMQFVSDFLLSQHPVTDFKQRCWCSGVCSAWHEWAFRVSSSANPCLRE